jgi:hypothetical protein
MMFVFLLAALAVAGFGVWLSRRGHVAGQVVMGLGGLALIGLIALQVKQNVLTPGPKRRNRYEMAVSFALANCMLGDAAGRSGSVVLLFPPRPVMSADAEQNYEDGFVAPLRHGRGNLSLKAVRLDGPDRNLSAFKKALDQAPEAMAVVSYAGVPPGFETLFRAAQTNMPFFYVFDAEGTTDWLGPLKDGRIKAVVVPRPGVGTGGSGAAAGMPEAIFDRFYLLATPESADEVAASLRSH